MSEGLMNISRIIHRRLIARSGTVTMAIAVCIALSAVAGLARQQPPSSSSALTSPQPAERLTNLPGLTNMGHIAPGIYRGAQPAADGYATLKKMGIKTVIDLRTSESEKAQVEAAGMQAIAVPIVMSRDGLKAKVERVVALMADPANQPVFVHCRHGQDRTGIVVAAYRMKVDKWPLAEAEKEMQQFGFNDIWINFKKFIRQYGRELHR